MKKLFLFIFIIGVFFTPIICYAEQDMIAIYGEDINDGIYTVEVNSSSSMFRIVNAELNVENGNMTADITLSGTGYLSLFMGTGEEAQNSEEYIPYQEKQEGIYSYTIPVKALNTEIDCAAYSKRKQKWYDRKIVFLASSLPKEALKNSANAKITKEYDSKMNIEDGNYTVEVHLNGGTGRTSILSPTHISVLDGTVTASIEWNSPNFDYMIVNGKKYYSISSSEINSEKNSIFEIPVLDTEFDVIADTVAMSKPHEIAYTLTFDLDTIQKEKNNIIIIIPIFIVILLFLYFLKQKKGVQNV